MTRSHNNILFSQLSLLSQFATITFHRAKHLIGPPMSVSVPTAGGSYCPVASINRCIALRGQAPDPLFALGAALICSTVGWLALYRIHLFHLCRYSRRCCRLYHSHWSNSRVTWPIAIFSRTASATWPVEV